MIRVAIAGAAGKMGREAVHALTQDGSFEVIGGLVRSPGQARDTLHIPLYDRAETLMDETSPDVWLDLTDVRSVIEHVDLAVAKGIRPVVGATGYTDVDVARWDKLARANGIGGIAVPNFAVGAILMMRFAAEAARLLPHAEIIELHHDGKKDAPSGTAKRTRDQMGLPDVPIHSVRLPGLVAHQEIIFGGYGETLTIRHDSLSRQSFMPGVLTACREVERLTGMVVGLEQLLF